MRRKDVAPVRALKWLILTALVWGVAAFGAVYPWAYTPLLVVLTIAGVGGMTISRGTLPGRGLCAALAVVAIAIGLQCVPLGLPVGSALSPRLPDVLRQIDPAFALGLSGSHPLSIYPAATLTALMIYVALALFFTGTCRLVSSAGTRPIAQGLVVCGTVVAFAGIIQDPFYDGKIYGFWTPEGPGQAFGPFVNRNHFAGWMIMVLGLAVGLASAELSELFRHRRTARERAIALAGGRGSRGVLYFAGASVMAIAIVLSESRSGLIALALVAAGFAVTALPRARNRVVLTTVVVCAIAFVSVWGRLDQVLARFSFEQGGDFELRLNVWKDTLRIAQDFPVTGTGLNTYSIATLVYPMSDTTSHWSAAHNDYLQVLAEGGLLLGVPVLALMFIFVREVRRASAGTSHDRVRWIRAGAVMGLLGIVAQEAVDFSLQMPGNAALFVMLAAIAAHQRPAARPQPEETP